MRSFTKLLFVLVIVTMFAACTTTGSSTSSSGTSSSSSANYQEPDKYFDFDDILIPNAIDYKADDSYKLDNAKFRASIMKFTGRVEVPELIQYFLNNMAKDNWTLISNNKANTLHVLTFEKFNKSCVIQVDDSFATAKTTIFAVEVKDSGSSLKAK